MIITAFKNMSQSLIMVLSPYVQSRIRSPPIYSIMFYSGVPIYSVQSLIVPIYSLTLFHKSLYLE